MKIISWPESMRTLFWLVTGKIMASKSMKFMLFENKWLKANRAWEKGQSTGMSSGKEENNMQSAYHKELPPFMDTKPWVKVFSKLTFLMCPLWWLLLTSTGGKQIQ